MEQLKIKVCGMRNPENITGVGALQPDFMGFIFYPGSKRYAPELMAGDLNTLPETTTPVGVFVNAEEEVLRETCHRLHLLTVQLHGDETPGYCGRLRDGGLKVIRAFGLRAAEDLEKVAAYTEVADLFLFDAAVPGYGGGGVPFDWGLLEHYRGPVPFLVSGGIGPDDAEAIRRLRHPYFYGIDLNSRFELSPGMKDTRALRNFMQKIRENEI